MVWGHKDSEATRKSLREEPQPPFVLPRFQTEGKKEKKRLSLIDKQLLGRYQNVESQYFLIPRLVKSLQWKTSMLVCLVQLRSAHLHHFWARAERQLYHIGIQRSVASRWFSMEKMVYNLVNRNILSETRVPNLDDACNQTMFWGFFFWQCVL